ncbi:MAG: RNA-binding transcriptional accessory protein, partial [Pseudomonadota bacterium]|nr:RNA-binding transcriptional accessory protein [Pseudomonadota bacterium]
PATIESRIAHELSATVQQVAAAVVLLDEGATVPFISRYRKEATGGLDDTQLRNLQERLIYLRELEERRAAVLASIEEQGKLTAVLRTSIEQADTKQRLEDLYLPYKLKRRTKAQIAREAGLGELAHALLADHGLAPEVEAAKYLKAAFRTEEGDNPGVPDTKSALEGARHVLMEQFAEDAELLANLRAHLQTHAVLLSVVAEGKEDAAAKFRDYFAYQEVFRTVPPHRALALFRGRKEAMLKVSLKLPEDIAAAEAAAPAPFNACEQRIAARFGIADRRQAADAWLLQTVRWTWAVKLSWQMETDLLTELRERAEEEAVRVFSQNLHDLLLAAPAGPRVTMGLDPGLRTGVKVAIVDRTGKLLETATVYPHVPRNDWSGTLAALAALAKKHAVELISIGNGTASRETDKLAGELMRQHPELKLTKVVVSEAGASVYSASELAANEFPALDVTLRGAVSIARRLQDPLAELVKIDPKSIGVGQYQHDVMQTRLARSLDAVVEDCVNAVGVDVNTASPALLARISGLSPSLADNIVRHRDQHGAFLSRGELKQVPRLGAKTFEQAAGFLRVMHGENPLDASAVHPEAYPVVERILAELKRPACEVIGDFATLEGLNPSRYTDERFGLPTVRDIIAELEKPARDPRPEFKTAEFKDGIEEIKDLRPGMILEGTVTNVTNFGAFVDIGVHQDGLVHISMLSNKFVKDPHEIVKAGAVVKVKVLEVDEKRKRIALTMRLDEQAARPRTLDTPRKHVSRPAAGADRERAQPQGNGAMAQALANAFKRNR